MEKINIAELLKDCPKGMELDCTMYDNCTYAGIEDVGYIDILINTPSGRIRLTKEGCYIRHDDNAKCVIFPKGKTTWEGFVPPCKFKDGDIIFTHTNTSKGLLEYSWISIFKEYRNNRCACYVCLCLSDLKLYYDKWEDMLLCELCEIKESRLATEEEKQKLFDAIKANGYKWNTETKTLEKLVEPKFKVGDRIQWHDTKINHLISIVKDIECGRYRLDNGSYIKFGDEHAYKLLKFDITTLKPFDKVLCRQNENCPWIISFFGFYDNEATTYPFICNNGFSYKQCIPYKGNEHLLGTREDCDEYYKTWEK